MNHSTQNNRASTFCSWDKGGVVSSQLPWCTTKPLTFKCRLTSGRYLATRLSSTRASTWTPRCWVGWGEEERHNSQDTCYLSTTPNTVGRMDRPIHCLHVCHCVATAIFRQGCDNAEPNKACFIALCECVGVGCECEGLTNPKS